MIAATDAESVGLIILGVLAALALLIFIIRR